MINQRQFLCVNNIKIAISEIICYDITGKKNVLSMFKGGVPWNN